jgi:hypothetical protein
VNLNAITILALKIPVKCKTYLNINVQNESIVTCTLVNATVIRGFRISHFVLLDLSLGRATIIHCTNLQHINERFVFWFGITSFLLLCNCNWLLAVSSELSQTLVSRPLKRVLCRLGREHLLESFNFLYFETTAASGFVTAETPLLSFHFQGNRLLCTLCRVCV